MKKQSFDDTPKTFVSEAIEYSVDFSVEPETARQRAHRIWKMSEVKEVAT
jgi:hypothetical protein